MIRCSICKRFIKNVMITEDFLGNVVKVEGECSKCGKVIAEWDCYEDLFGYGEEAEA